MAIRTPLLFFGVAALALGAVVRLPYRTSELSRVESASEAPAPDGSFRVGEIAWDTPRFAQEPRLAPLRTFFHEHCAGTTGETAATCVSDAFARAFAKGVPRHELFDREYDPAADLAAHAAGEPGHCVTRSGLMSAVLLSVGIPAKVLQLLGASGVGHTVMSVWDDHRGWLVYDPSFGSFVTVGGQVASTSHLVSSSADLATVPAGLVPGNGDHGQGTYDELGGGGLTILVPEPWLYMRVGERLAHPPMRGRFAVLGATRWNVGPAQTAARGVFVAGLLLGLASLLAARLRRRGPSAAGVVDSAPAIEPAE